MGTPIAGWLDGKSRKQNKRGCFGGKLGNLRVFYRIKSPDHINHLHSMNPNKCKSRKKPWLIPPIYGVFVGAVLTLLTSIIYIYACVMYSHFKKWPFDMLVPKIVKLSNGIQHPQWLTILMGSINHQNMGGLWHCFTHITWGYIAGLTINNWDLVTFIRLHTYIYIYVYIYLCMYIYIYTERKREREGEREREKERASAGWRILTSHCDVTVCRWGAVHHSSE